MGNTYRVIGYGRNDDGTQSIVDIIEFDRVRHGLTPRNAKKMLRRYAGAFRAVTLRGYIANGEFVETHRRKNSMF